MSATKSSLPHDLAALCHSVVKRRTCLRRRVNLPEEMGDDVITCLRQALLEIFAGRQMGMDAFIPVDSKVGPGVDCVLSNNRVMIIY